MYAVNDTQQDLVVLLKNDLVSEQTESFFVDLSSPIGTPCDTAIVLIQDDDQPPSMSLTHSILIEHKLKNITLLYPLYHSLVRIGRHSLH